MEQTKTQALDIVLFEERLPSHTRQPIETFTIETIQKDIMHNVYRTLKPNNEFHQWIIENRVQLIPCNIEVQQKKGYHGNYYDDLKYDVPHSNLKTLFFIYSFFCICEKGNEYSSTFNENGLHYERKITQSKWNTYYNIKKEEKKKVTNLFGLIKKYKNISCILNIFGPFTDDPRYSNHRPAPM